MAHKFSRRSSLKRCQQVLEKRLHPVKEKQKATWSVDAVYKDASGTANFNEAETKAVTKIQRCRKVI